MENENGHDDTSNIETEGEAGEVEVQDTDTNKTTSKDTVNAELVKARELAENYKRRAEKAEERLKNPKSKSAEEDHSTPKKEVNSSSFSKEEARVFTQILSSGLPEELSDSALERVNKISNLEGISLTEAYKSDDFKFWKERVVKNHLHEQAQLGASRGGTASSTKDFSTSNLSEEEHKALWFKKMN